jgi:uncharacterized protein (DUF2344 family)
MDSIHPELIVFVGMVIVAALGLALGLWRKVKRDQVQQFVQQHAPEDLKGIAVWAARTAYDAVEQVASAYEAMSNEEKQAQAAKWAEALYKWITTGIASREAATALLEAQIHASKIGKGG